MVYPRASRTIHKVEGDLATQALTTVARADVDPLELTHGFIQWVKRAAGNGRALINHDKKHAPGRPVLCRQLGQFGLETLKAQIDAEFLGIFDKQSPRDLHQRVPGIVDNLEAQHFSVPSKTVTASPQRPTRGPRTSTPTTPPRLLA